LNILIARLRQDTTFKHLQLIGNRYLPAVFHSHFTYFAYPIVKDVGGITLDHCAFKHAVSNAVSIQSPEWEYDRDL
jgi:hypothetical protein